MRPLGDGIVDHAVDTHGREEQRDAAEHQQQRHRKAGLRHTGVQDVFHRRHAGHWHVGIQRSHLTSNRRYQRARIGTRAYDETHRGGGKTHRRRELLVGRVELRVDDLAEALVVYVTHDAHDLEPRRFIVAQLNAVPQGAVGPIEVGHGIVDDDHRLPVGPVPAVEETPLLQRNAHHLEVSGRDHLPVEGGGHQYH